MHIEISLDVLIFIFAASCFLNLLCGMNIDQTVIFISRAEDAGSYKCIAENTAGETTAEFTLNVQSKFISFLGVNFD